MVLLLCTLMKTSRESEDKDVMYFTAFGEFWLINYEIMKK